MDKQIIDKFQEKKSLPEVRVGDTIKAHLRIKDGDKERTQIFEGIVIAKKGKHNNKSLTIRKISFGIGVEKIIPLNTPTLQKIEVIKRAKKVRKSKLYNIRKKIGKKAMDVGLTDYMEQEDLSPKETPETTEGNNKDNETTSKENDEKNTKASSDENKETTEDTDK